MSHGTGIGYIDRQNAFAKRHAAFFQRFPNLTTAINTAFDRTITATGALDPVIFYLGIRVVDDFEAIVVNTANDLALPAQSLLRGMYERIVTSSHLHHHPEDVTAFAEYDYVQRRKVAIAIRDTLGVSPEQDSAMQELELEYQRVKDRYLVACEKCGHKRVGPSWTKLDFVTMAKQQEHFADCLVHAYYLPLLQAHSTLRSASAVFEVKDGKPIFRTNHIELSDEVFRLAYVLILGSLQLQLYHFNPLRLATVLQIAVNDHLEIYPDEDEQQSPSLPGA
jgi:hypothetical protein